VHRRPSEDLVEVPEIDLIVQVCWQAVTARLLWGWSPSEGQVVGLRTVLLVLCGLLVVKFCVVAFWMQDQMYQRAARLNLVAALICLTAVGAGFAGLEAAALAGAVLAVLLDISSFHLVRIGRG